MTGYRTIIFNVLAALAAFAARKGWISSDPDTINLLTDLILALFFGGNIGLRAVTTTAIGRKS